MKRNSLRVWALVLALAVLLSACAYTEKTPTSSAESQPTSAVPVSSDPMSSAPVQSELPSSSAVESTPVSQVDWNGYFVREDGENARRFFHVLQENDCFYAEFIMQWKEPDSGYYDEPRTNMLIGHAEKDGVLFDNFPPDTYFITLSADGNTLTMESVEGEQRGESSGVYRRVANTAPAFTVPTLPEAVWDENCEVKLDASLAQGIRQSIGLSENEYLTRETLENILMLQIFDTPVVSLNGISALSNLEDLSISSGSITDADELAQLAHLRSVDISWCYLSAVPDLSVCKDLAVLRLAANRITDASALAKMPWLTDVCLDGNLIHSVRPFLPLTQVQYLNINGLCITDYALLKDNPALQQAIDNGSNFTYADALAVEELAKEVSAQVTADAQTDLEKIEAIFRYMIDTTEFEAGSYSLRAYGERVLRTHVGVCGNYAETFALLCNHAGVWADVCNSSDHAWNIVELDGQRYHCDALWDESSYFWQYFCRSTAYIQVRASHAHDVWRYGLCPEDLSPLLYDAR